MISTRGGRARRQLLSLILPVSLASWACGLTSRGEFDGLVPRPRAGVGGAGCASPPDPHQPNCAAMGSAGTGALVQGGAAGVAEAAGAAGAAKVPGEGDAGASNAPLKTGVEVRSGGFVVGSPGASSGTIRVLGSFVSFSPDVPAVGSSVVVRGAFQ